MVDARLVERKLAALLSCVERVRQKRAESKETFLADRDARELAAFNLFLAFQDAIDLAAHFIADAAWELPTTAREHFEILAKHGFIDAELADALAACAGARNLIAHAYGTMDFERLHREIPKGLEALDAFASICEAASRPP